MKHHFGTQGARRPATQNAPAHLVSSLSRIVHACATRPLFPGSNPPSTHMAPTLCLKHTVMNTYSGDVRWGCSFGDCKITWPVILGTLTGSWTLRTKTTFQTFQTIYLPLTLYKCTILPAPPASALSFGVRPIEK